MDSQDSSESNSATEAEPDPQEERNKRLQAAVDLHRSGDFEGAHARYLELLDEMPCDPMALHFMGLLRHHLGKHQDAERLIGRALVFAPNYVEALNNLGNVFDDRGAHAEADRCFERALAINPEFLSALNNLAVVRRKRGAYADALALCEKAVSLDPNFYEGHHNRGTTLRTMGRHEEAVEALTKAASLKKGFRAYYNLGMALYSAGQLQEAKVAFEKILEEDPENPLGLHMVAASSADEAPPARASDEYVKAVFNGFANRFDAILEGLDYRVPSFIGDLVAEIYQEPEANLSILDLGCGTGLCGKFTKPYAKRMVGIDLAADMLREAANTDDYDELHEVEITAFLREHDEQFDVLLSGDTLIYFGELDEVFELARRRLVPEGHLVFSLEALDGSDPYVLRPHGRYAHSLDYLRRAVETAGLEFSVFKNVHLRKEGGTPVDGFLVALRKPA